jgi:predicted transcriptional regulator of viral defense system
MDMSYAEKIRGKIEILPSGKVITIKMFPSTWPRNATTRALSRLAKDGFIERVKKGVYSKVKKTRFGKVSSTPLEILATEVVENDNKCFGGLFLFNNFGLTTQVPSVIEILNNKSSYTSKIGATTVRYVRIRPQINKNTKKYIPILEVLKSSKSIPDSSIEKTFEWLLKELRSLDEKRLKELIKVSLDYPPRIRAILGNIFQSERKRMFADKLKHTLNQNSTYKAGQITTLLKNTKEWRLKI